MKKLLITLMLVLGFATSGWALTYDLTQHIAATLSDVASFGTVTLVDSGDNVVVTVDLNGSGTMRVQEVMLNYDPVFSSATAFTVSPGTISNVEDGIKADGYSAGSFDLQIPATGTLGFEPQIFTLSLAGVNLDPTNFDFTDTSGELHVAVHIGNIDALGNSIWVGDGDGGGGQQEVPEPTTILLIGIGMAGLAFVGWRRN